MPRLAFKRCRNCGRPSSDVGVLSWTRLCVECGDTILTDNVMGLHTHSGQPFLRWRRAMAASVGAILLDEHEEGA